MAKGSHTQSLRAYLRDQEKAINQTAMNRMKNNNLHPTHMSGGGNRPMGRGH